MATAEQPAPSPPPALYPLASLFSFRSRRTHTPAASCGAAPPEPAPPAAAAAAHPAARAAPPATNTRWTRPAAQQNGQAGQAANLTHTHLTGHTVAKRCRTCARASWHGPVLLVPCRTHQHDLGTQRLHEPVPPACLPAPTADPPTHRAARPPLLRPAPPLHWVPFSLGWYLQSPPARPPDTTCRRTCGSSPSARSASSPSAATSQRAGGRWRHTAIAHSRLHSS